MRYPNKIDLWIRWTLYVVVLMYVPLFFVVPPDELWILLAMMLFTGLLVLPFLYGYVELQDERLEVRMGYIRWRIPYDRIKSIRLCSNFFSSMALTRQRIELKEHGKSFLRGTTYIGPVNREEVYDELRRRCPNLEDNA